MRGPANVEAEVLSAHAGFDHQVQSTPSFPLKKVRFFFQVSWALVVLLHSLLWASSVSLAVGAMAILGGIAGTQYALRREILRRAPISTAIVLGYTAYYFLLPSLATLAEGKALTHNLLHPLLVHTHALIGLFTLLLAHLFYRGFLPLQSLRQFVVRQIFRPIGYFSPVTNWQLLIMGAFGLIAMAYQVLVAGATQQDALGTGNKLMQAMYPLAYLPFCMLLSGLTPGATQLNTRWIGVLMAYMLILLAVALAQNARITIFIGAMSVALCFSYGVAAGITSPRWLKAKYLVPGFGMALVLLGPVADLATSMVIVRGQRADIPPLVLLQRTLTTFADKDAIRDARLPSAEVNVNWNEAYVDNIFLARLSNLKFTDNALDIALRMDAADRTYLRTLEFQKALAILPRPVLKAIAPWVDKDFVGSSSGGDLMLYTVTHNASVLGGFRTGSLLGSAFALFGWLYPAALAVMLFPFFALADAQTTKSSLEGHAVPVIAPMAAVAFFTWFFSMTSAATGLESFSSMFGLLMRGWIQVALIYAAALWTARLISRLRLG